MTNITQSLTNRGYKEVSVPINAELCYSELCCYTRTAGKRVKSMYTKNGYAYCLLYDGSFVDGCGGEIIAGNIISLS